MIKLLPQKIKLCNHLWHSCTNIKKIKAISSWTGQNYDYNRFSECDIMCIGNMNYLEVCQMLLGLSSSSEQFHISISI